MPAADGMAPVDPATACIIVVSRAHGTRPRPRPVRMTNPRIDAVIVPKSHQPVFKPRYRLPRARTMPISEPTIRARGVSSLASKALSAGARSVILAEHGEALVCRRSLLLQ